MSHPVSTPHRFGQELSPARRARRLGCQVAAVLLAAAGLATSTPAAAQALAVRDQRGVEVKLPRPAQRVVSLLPSLTETVCLLGACPRLVATDRWSNWPASVQALPKAGGLDDANLEQILAVRPDLVLAARSTRVAERLEALGIPVAVFEAEKLSEVQAVLAGVAALLGLDTAPHLWRQIQRQMDSAQAQVPASARGKTVYFEVESSPYAAGEASFIGETLSRLGARHVVPASLGPFPKLNPEFVVRADPELIILSATQHAGLARRPGWDRLQALRKGQVCAVPPADYDLIVRPGPRMGVAALTLARCLTLVAERVPPQARP